MVLVTYGTVPSNPPVAKSSSRQLIIAAVALALVAVVALTAVAVSVQRNDAVEDEQVFPAGWARTTMLDDKKAEVKLPKSFKQAVADQKYFAGKDGPKTEEWDVDPKLIAKK